MQFSFRSTYQEWVDDPAQLTQLGVMKGLVPSGMFFLLRKLFDNGEIFSHLMGIEDPHW